MRGALLQLQFSDTVLYPRIFSLQKEIFRLNDDNHRVKPVSKTTSFFL